MAATGKKSLNSTGILIITNNKFIPMLVEVKIPSPGESVTEVSIGSWLVEDNEYVTKDQEIAEVETDKATLPLISPESGLIKILSGPGTKAKPGDVACTIDTSLRKEAAEPPGIKKKELNLNVRTSEDDEARDIKEPASDESTKDVAIDDKTGNSGTHYPEVKITPVARRMMEEYDLNVDDIIKGLKKISGRHVEKVIGLMSGKVKSPETAPERKTESIPMSAFRRKLASRLVAAKNETAMLTTFNEVDMSALLDLRKRYQQKFQEKHGIKLGITSFFVKAASEALGKFPKVNAMIEGDKIIYRHFADISVAVQTEKGLMVPVVRNADLLGIPEIEKEISDLAAKARNNKLPIESMTGGTFTITNGGIYGSMLSTPLINPPQSAILGMHNIVERAVVIEGRIEIRPVMYMALSYDHRMIDGKDSVSFLAYIKKLIENPVLITGKDRELELLNL